MALSYPFPPSAPDRDVAAAMASNTRGRQEVDRDIETTLSSADPALGRVIAAVVSRVGRMRASATGAHPFAALVRAVTHQGISAGSATAIYRRLEQATPGGLAPGRFLSLAPETLRTAGLSSVKAHALRNLAEWFERDGTDAGRMECMGNDEIVAALTRVSGIGAWTAAMFMIFDLGRLDVIPAGDAGLRRGAQLAYGLERLPLPSWVRERGATWQPYASIGSIYLWQAVKLRLQRTDLLDGTMRG